MCPADDTWWRNDRVAADEPAVHALVIGVSRYDHLEGGRKARCADRLLAGLGQLSAAATSATRVAIWLRDHFDLPQVRLGSIRLLASPSPAEQPLPEGGKPPLATAARVRKALAAWRRDARGHTDSVPLLYVAGHGIQTTREDGILLLQDVGDPELAILDAAVDLGTVRNGMVGQPGQDRDACTPALQFYLYDACRVEPDAVGDYRALRPGIVWDEPRGPWAQGSYVLFGSRSGDYALADPDARTTLFSQAFTEVLEKRAEADDGRTVRWGSFSQAMETAVAELAATYGERQSVIPGGEGSSYSPFYLRPAQPAPAMPPVPVMPPRRPVEPEAAGDLPDLIDAGPHRLPPAARRVLLELAGGQRRPVSVTGPGVRLEALTGEPVELPLGRYTVSADLPWGGGVRDDIEVVPGPVPLRATLAAPAQGPATIADAPRLIRRLAPGGPAAWLLRFLTWTPAGLRFDPSVPSPEIEVVSAVDGAVALRVRAVAETPAYAHLRAGAGRPLVVALPISRAARGAAACWLHVAVTPAGVGAVVRLVDPDADACAGYLTGGRPDHVVALAGPVEDPSAGDADPVAAALAGYALLRLNEPGRVGGWAGRLADRFAWLPDGALIAGEAAARLGDAAAAARQFTRALDRGLPLFTEGLTLLSGRIPRLLGSPALPDAARAGLEAAASPALNLALTADFGALASTLNADPDPGTISAVRGWRRFVPGVAASRPSDFWSEP